MVKCFAEVLGPEESCIRDAPFCCCLCCDLFSCFSVCDQCPTPMFSLQFLNEFDWISADSNNRHHTVWTDMGRKFSTVHAFPGSCKLACLEYDMTEGGLPLSSHRSATLAQSPTTPLGSALSSRLERPSGPVDPAAPESALFQASSSGMVHSMPSVLFLLAQLLDRFNQTVTASF